MKQRRGGQRGSDERDKEILKGKIRELQKEIKKLQNYINYLEKRSYSKEIDVKVTHKEVEAAKPTENLCPKCQESNLKHFIIPKIDGELSLMICESCGHREKK